MVEFCEIPFIGYLVMTQFIEFSAIQEQQLIAYWSKSNKMQNAPMCYGDIYLVSVSQNSMLRQNLTISN